MLHVTTPDQTFLYTGDFKLRSCLTVEQADPPQADCLLMESTFGRPIFRFPPWRQVADQMLDLVADALRDGRQPMVLGYSLGKAQEITRILTDAGFNVTCHGAVFALNEVAERFGMQLGRYRKYHPDDFHGPRALDLAERGVLVAPPNVARSPFAARFERSMKIMLTGWSMLKGANYRYGVDHALPISDHADFDELLELVERVRPKRIYTHHGYPEFADELKRRGHHASLARPPRQMLLFE